MLPGFRFLFAAILLSISFLVFGLGAAALLRSTHQQVVSSPSWRKGPQDQMFEPAPPVLAMFQVEPTPEPTSLRDEIPTIGLPATVTSTGRADVAAPNSEGDRENTVSTPEMASAEPWAIATSIPDEAPAPAAPSSEAVPASQDVSIEETATIVAARPEATSAESSEPVTPEATAPAAIPTPKARAISVAPAKAKAAKTARKPAAKRRAHHVHRTKKHTHVARRPAPAAPVQQTFDPFAAQPTYAATRPR